MLATIRDYENRRWRMALLTALFTYVTTAADVILLRHRARSAIVTVTRAH